MNTQIETIVDQVSQVILGKKNVIRLALSCLLARGHLLLEDIPGIGKTTLAQALSRSLGLSLKRIQFTSDLLPADVIGTNIFDPATGQFQFRHGPVFCQCLLADEINRSGPKTQSALLEAMEEEQVTVDGQTYPLQRPFFVIATQNPVHQLGTYPLPESQLDRFLMKLSLGYPEAWAERQLLNGFDRREKLAAIKAVADGNGIERWQTQSSQVFVDEKIYVYVQSLLNHSRQNGYLHGLSPRAGMGLLNAARAWAWIEGRDHVYPEDVQTVFPAVVNHRLAGRDAGEGGGDPAREILHAVHVA